MPELVAAQRTDDGGWDLAVVRHGRLAGSARAPVGADPRAVDAAAVATAETVQPGHGPLTAASAEEIDLVLRWLDHARHPAGQPRRPWVSPVRGAGAHRSWVERSSSAPAAADPQADRRGLRPLHRPAR